MYATQRWPDVLLTAAGSAAAGDRHGRCNGIDLCVGGSRRGASRPVALDWLDRVDVIGHTKSSGRFDADVLTASIGPSDIPLLVADLAYVRGMVHRQLGEEDKAQIWLSKATINGVLTEAAKAALADPNLHLLISDEQFIATRTNRSGCFDGENPK